MKQISLRLILLSLACSALALSQGALPQGALPQQTSNESPPPGEIPLVTGAVGFLADLQSGHQAFGPKFEPILLFPISKRLLIETEYSTNLPVPRDDGKLGAAVLQHAVEYMQIDYSATSNITIVGGYFVTPFGIYKERIDPLWIRNLIDVPLLYPINDNSSNGVMVRGGFFAAPWLKLNYALSVSANVDNSQFASNKQTSDRVSVYLPKTHLELGASYSRVLQAQPYDVHGFDATWNVTPLRLDVRGEGIWSAPLGHAYWIEAAYRFPAGSNAFLKRSQPVIRGEQYWASADSASINPDVPQQDTRRVSFGWNYWFNDAVRANVAYAREWDTEAANVMTLGLIYRFTLPGERTR